MKVIGFDPEALSFEDPNLDSLILQDTRSMGSDAVQASTSVARALKPGMNAAEWRARVDLAAAFRLAALQNWDELLFAHLSARVPGHTSPWTDL